MKTNNERIKATANHNEHTFTLEIFINDELHATYKTIELPEDEFNSCLYNTQNDWRDFLKSDDYYLVR